ncbi:hypothetical protein CXG81DRAFT_11291 [Caulochytrium protostelioides]|uniref:EF-hand n=1 Tax=Caulochytrium protostelioides TaxID=1555241 RepID=A0A4P9X9P5_9FUNG|nr:hypothetical protein CXG81DRAFT_11291 [Caulochytrium protostelioides]|eukprot:RKP02025.1 hypothetical protein CXG81DRAFT_11291 [Caulochytrium protostelioides]
MRPSPLSVAVAAADLGAGGPRRGGHAPPNPPALEHHRAPLPVALRAPPPKEHETLLALLYTLAEDQARREGFVHRSITCNHCSASPIRGVRYKCVNCVDFDLCELCEADNHQHYKTHVFLKIRIPIPPLANPRSVLLAPFYPGVDFSAATGVLHAQPGLLLQLARETHFDALEIEAFYEQFRSLATPPPPAVVADHAAHAPASTAAARVPEGLFLSDGVITKEIFGQCLGPLGRERNLITDRIFHFFDARRDGVITFPEFVRGLSVLCKGGFDERLMAAFRGYDLDGNGVISRAELHQMFKAYFYLSMELVRDVVRTMEEGMMDAFDDEAAKPVSSAFSAPIPPGAMSHHDSDDDDNGDDGDDGGDDNDDGGDPDAASHLARAGDRHGEGGGDETGAAGQISPLTAPRTLNSPLQRAAMGATAAAAAAASPWPRAAAAAAPFDEFPVMEAMSQDAVAEMVDRTFAAAGVGATGSADADGMTFAQFRAVVETDNNLLAWFEALGPIF